MTKGGAGVGFILLIIFLSGFVCAANVAYITVNPKYADQVVIKEFNDLGFNVTLIKSSSVKTADFSQFKLIFVGDEYFYNRNDIFNYAIGRFPSIVMNSRHAVDWGFVNIDGISLLASTSPLTVDEGGNILQVYTFAKDPKNLQVSIPYYYLSDRNRAARFSEIARTNGFTSNNLYDGDVVASVKAGTSLLNIRTAEAGICFYGIVKTGFWTDNAKNLFNKCVNSVLVECIKDLDCDDGNQRTEDKCVENKCVHSNISCFSADECGNSGYTGDLFCSGNNVVQNYLSFTCNNAGAASSFCSNNTNVLVNQTCEFGCNNGECLPGVHDVALINFTNSIGGIRLEFENGTDILGSQLQCNQKYIVGVEAKNLGDFSENVTFNGSIGSLLFNHNPILNFDSLASSLKTKTVNFSLSSGFYNVSVQAAIPVDSNLSNNFASRTIEIICEQPMINCSHDSDCGNNVLSELMCSEDNVVKQFTNYSCENPGTGESKCINNSGALIIQTCSKSCSQGSCVNITCSNNSECDDGNPRTADSCVKPGMADSYCRNTEVNCLEDNDCGFNGFLGNNFCFMNNVFKNYQNSTCINPGTLDSNCVVSIIPKETQNCNDNNSATLDVCEDSQEALCRHTLTSCSMDSDCGKEEIINQICNGSQLINNVSAPLCINSGKENASCSSVFSLRLNQTCEFGCSNGECLLPECTKNSDCGNISLINNYCSGNNVTSNYSMPLCLGESCSTSFSSVLNASCADGCLNGACVNIRCRNNSECDDGNASTLDTCLLPGSANSSCVHNFITCKLNSDCGNNRFIGNSFCLESNVMRNFAAFNCNNNRTTSSFCSNETSLKLINICSYGCSNGACL